MASSEDRDYCRHCGSGQGHTSAKCTNVSKIKATLACVDGELESASERIAHLLEFESRCEEVEKSNRSLNRIVFALLDLAEVKRGSHA